MTNIALHFAPHPDDELIGAPATLMALRDAGWRVVNLACGLGRPEQQKRREAELREACRLAGFELMISERPISRDDDRAAAYATLLGLARETIDDLAPRIVLSPSPHDRHRAHELVAGAVRDALGERLGSSAPRWWMWALWGTLPQPTLGTAFDQARLDEIISALSAHRGELERNDYRLTVKARAALNASLAPELLFGFGSERSSDVPYAELLTEVALCDGRWLLGSARWLDPGAPITRPTRQPISEVRGCDPWRLLSS